MIIAAGSPKSPFHPSAWRSRMRVPEESTASCVCAAAPSSSRHIAWDIGELLIGYCLILAVIWTPRPLQHWLYYIALGWFIVSILLSFEG